MSIPTVETAAEAPGRPKLLFRSGPCRGKVLLVDSDQVTFGRDAQNDIVFEVDIISSRHAVLSRVPGDSPGSFAYWLEDLGSKNGTFLNGKRITRAELANGDVFWLCQQGQEIEFTLGEPSLPSLWATSTATFQRTGSLEHALRELLPSNRNAVSISGIRETVGKSLEDASRKSRQAVAVGTAVISAVLLAGFVTVAWVLSGNSGGGTLRSGNLSSAPAGSHAAGVPRSEVRLELELETIYGSLFHSYRDEGIGEVRLRNTGTEPLRGAVLLVDILMDGKSLLAEEVRMDVPDVAAGAGWKAALFPVLSAQVVAERSREATAIARLQHKGELLESLTRAVPIHDYHVFSWDRPERIGVFVDPNDPAVKSFVDMAWASRPEISEQEFPPSNVVGAVTLLTALAGRKLHYKPDATTPFSGSSSWKARDRVNYPWETLLHGTGDCDDLVVLCCSVLESAGIPAAVVIGEAHVLFMFDTGIEAPAGTLPASGEGGLERGALFPPGSWVRRGGRLWLPVEATEIARRDGGFAPAWGSAWHRSGAISKGELKVVEVREGWTRYKPLHPAPGEDVLRLVRNPETWAQPELGERVRAALEAIRAHARENVRRASLELEERYDGLGLAQARALLYAHSGLYRDAARVLEHALFGPRIPATTAALREWAGRSTDEGVSVDAAFLLSDLALATALSAVAAEELDRAAEYYIIAIRALPDDLPEKAEMMARLGIIYRERGDLESSRKWTRQALALNPALEETLALLERGDGTVAAFGKSPAALEYLRRGMRGAGTSRLR